MSEPTPHEPEEQLLIDTRALARQLDVAPRTVQRLRAAGKLPEPVELGGSVKWRMDEVRRWVAAGCPTREDWKQRGGDRCRDC
jgi:predicted DNA-binding transcriptional regulator AlpA